MGIDDEMLAAGLGIAAILERRVLPALCSAECEIVTCRTADGAARQLLCKSASLAEAEAASHHFGVAYEAQVYDQLLQPWKVNVPALHGAFVNETSQTVVLAIDWLVDAVPLQQLQEPQAGLLAATEWIARFHRWSETSGVPAFLHRYDTDFYRVVLERAGHATRGLHEQEPWLPELCERCQRRLPALLPPTTIIHGEYQADNILVWNGNNVAIDWESAALAAGEIDLANLTWDCGGDLASLCEQQYCLTRWPDGTPDDFTLRLTAARVYLHLRWLAEADPAEATTSDLTELRQLAEKQRDS